MEHVAGNRGPALKPGYHLLLIFGRLAPKPTLIFVGCYRVRAGLLAHPGSGRRLNGPLRFSNLREVREERIPEAVDDGGRHVADPHLLYRTRLHDHRRWDPANQTAHKGLRNGRHREANTIVVDVRLDLGIRRGDDPNDPGKGGGLDHGIRDFHELRAVRAVRSEVGNEDFSADVSRGTIGPRMPPLPADLERARVEHELPVLTLVPLSSPCEPGETECHDENQRDLPQRHFERRRPSSPGGDNEKREGGIDRDALVDRWLDVSAVAPAILGLPAADSPPADGSQDDEQQNRDRVNQGWGGSGEQRYTPARFQACRGRHGGTDEIPADPAE